MYTIKPNFDFSNYLSIKCMLLILCSKHNLIVYDLYNFIYYRGEKLLITSYYLHKIYLTDNIATYLY